MLRCETIGKNSWRWKQARCAGDKTCLSKWRGTSQHGDDVIVDRHQGGSMLRARSGPSGVETLPGPLSPPKAEWISLGDSDLQRVGVCAFFQLPSFLRAFQRPPSPHHTTQRPDSVVAGITSAVAVSANASYVPCCVACLARGRPFNSFAEMH